MTRPLRLLVVVGAAALFGWATPPATAQVRVTVGYYPTVTGYYAPAYYYAQPVYPAVPYGWYPTPPSYQYWYGYNYQWNYSYRPWGGYYAPGYQGYYTRPTWGVSYWRRW